MGSIIDTYAEKEVMSHKMWNACLKLDMIEWKALNSKGHMPTNE